MNLVHKVALAVITLATAAFLYATTPSDRTYADGVNPTSQVALATDKTGYLSDDQAPLRFRSNNTAIVSFVSVIEQYCGIAPPGYVFMACETLYKGNPVIFMPNPCAYPDSDAYAHLLCHELGHVNGWPATHGK